jgi:hypothetical protein
MHECWIFDLAKKVGDTLPQQQFDEAAADADGVRYNVRCHPNWSTRREKPG